MPAKTYFTIALPLLALFLFSGSSTPAGDPAAAEYRFHEPDRGWVARALKKMTLREKVAQLVKIRVPGRFLNRRSPEYLEIEDQIRRNGIGGVILFAGNVYESALLLNNLQAASDIPLLVSADFERGASFRIADTTSFPWTMALGAAGSDEFAYQQGAITAREARALGVHWIFAPVVDVNNNPDNPVINIRSFGEDPALVARLGAAFIRGARDRGVMTTAKHFPGHGDTAVDSHIGLAVIPSDRARLDAVELVPFKSAIDAGVDSIMTAHVAVPQVTAEPGVPATLSPKILTDLLRDSLGFGGLIVTDAMEMGGITTKFWTGLAAIRALQAGADMLLLPPDNDVAINEVVRAVQRGDIPQDRIDRSVERVLMIKTRLRLHKERMVPIDRIDDVVASPESRKLAQEMAEGSMTLLRDRQQLLPLDVINPPRIYSLVLSSDLDASPGATFQAEMRARFPAVRTASLDPRTPEDLVSGIVKNASEAELVVIATIVRVVSGKGNVALPPNQQAVIERILAAGKPVVWVAFGNPYILSLFPQLPTYMCTFSYSDVSQSAAAKALAGEIAIGGRMPVSIPGHSSVGEGLAVARRNMTLGVPSREKAELWATAFQATRSMLESHVRDGAFPGAALIVGYKGEMVLEAYAGRFDYDAGSPAVTGDTVYDLASLSKVIGTTSAAMMLAESGRLLLATPVQDYLPEFKGENKDRVRVEHLLRHASGLPAWGALYRESRNREDFLGKVYAIPLEYEPGTRMVYSDFGMILLGEIIERASAASLDRLVAARLFGPLGMTSTLYNPPRALLPRIPPTEDDPWRRRVVRGEVHDENAAAMGGVAGHAGLFGSARDLTRFAQMMLNRGIYDHVRVFKQETVDRYTGNTVGSAGNQALGWRKPSAANWTGAVFSPSAYGHTGFTGTSLWIDPQRQAFILLLSNRVHPTRQNQKIDEVRRGISESVMRVLSTQQGTPGR